MLPWALSLHAGQNVIERLKGISLEISDVQVIPRVRFLAPSSGYSRAW